MSACSSTAALDEIRELTDFTAHHNSQVRLQACKMVTSLSALEDNRRLIAQTPMVAALAKQMTDLKEISREVYKALINLAEHEELYQQMLKANLIAIAMECLRDSATDLEMRELILMFLVNMSRDEKGASALMQEGEEVEGLHVRRLLNWFTQFVPPVKSGKAPVLDPNAYCAHILTNISQTAPGRRLLMNAERGYLASLKPQLSSTNDIRRMGCFQLMKNCFIEDTHHATLLSKQLGLVPHLLAPIIGPEPFLHGEAEYKGIDPAVRALMTPEKRRDPDPQLRVLVYEIILLCARHKPSRVTLRAQCMYPILRHAHDAEKADEDPAARELDELLETIVPFFILDEDDALHPDQIEAEKKRARIDQLKQINDDEEHKGETPEERKARKAAEAAALDKPVHYLGDELGGDVRRKQQQEEAAGARGLSAPLPPVAASSVAPRLPSDAPDEDDETFPDVEPLDAAEAVQLGDAPADGVSRMTLEEAKAALHAPAPKAVVYAEAAPDDDDEEDQQRQQSDRLHAVEDDDDDNDEPPPLADEEEEEEEEEEREYDMDALD